MLFHRAHKQVAGQPELDSIMKMIKEGFPNYNSEISTIDHTHMTMGRKDDRSRDIKEAIIFLQRK